MNEKTETHKKSGVIALGLAALGVVYGDIGTSPLYAMKEIFFGKEGVHVEHLAVMGVTSTIFWALTLIVSINYIFFVLRADHEKEGGVFALYALLRHIGAKHKVVVLGLLVLAAGLLFGDGIITPAISVVSAVEGIGIAAPSLNAYIIPITLLILTGLFAVQKNGTSKIGAVFGPVMLVWFLVIGLIGLSNVFGNPEIINILNPIWVIRFFSTVPIREILIILGFVMLVVTGGEAMYADMGHFGIGPIRLGWLSVAYPMLVLNYLGQGAYLLSGKSVIDGSIFYSMAPGWALYPLIALATLATIIASQALITGAFSLAAQAYSLYLLPYLPTKHTHGEHEGQIYIPIINSFLYVGCVMLVIIFRSSTNLASIYGLAVSLVMLVTTLSVGHISYYIWKWKLWQTLLVFVFFGFFDATFVVANSLKFFDGGYVPVSIGLTMLLVMSIWKWGSDTVQKTLTKESDMTLRKLLNSRMKNESFMPGTVVILSNKFLTKPSDIVPYLGKLYLDKYELLPEHLVFLTVHVHHEPNMESERFTLVPIDLDPTTGTVVSVRLNFGFMEEVKIEPYLSKLAKGYPVAVDEEISNWVIHVVEPRILVKEKIAVWANVRATIFQILFRLSPNEDEQFGLGRKNHLTAEVVPVTIQ